MGNNFPAASSNQPPGFRHLAWLLKSVRFQPDLPRRASPSRMNSLKPHQPLKKWCFPMSKSIAILLGLGALLGPALVAADPTARSSDAAVSGSTTLGVAALLSAPAEDAVTVKVVGKLRTGLVAIGGETTGTAVQSKGINWELDFAKNSELKKTAEKLNGQRVTVEGSLEHRTGIEVKNRWIITVTKLEAVQE